MLIVAFFFVQDVQKRSVTELEEIKESIRKLQENYKEVKSVKNLNRDFKIQQRGQQQERRLKSECWFLQSLQRLFLRTYFVKCRRTLQKLNFKGPQPIKLKQRNKISSLLVYVLHKPQNLAFSCRRHAKTGKKCTKKRDARAKLLFCSLNQLFILHSRCCLRQWILNSLVCLGHRKWFSSSVTFF